MGNKSIPKLQNPTNPQAAPKKPPNHHTEMRKKSIQNPKQHPNQHTEL